MENKQSLYHLVVLAIFIGTLLSFAAYFLVTCAVGPKNDVNPTCFDGSVIEGDAPTQRFERAVYQSRDSLSFIRRNRYRLLGTAGHENVIAGDDGFLFEIEDATLGYNYLEDYLGQLSFSEEETLAIFETLKAREAALAEQDIKYLLVVLPNAQTVYSENMPSYLGDVNDRETRLDRLEADLLASGFTSFINLTDVLMEYKGEGPLYNNTENSLNALGLYYTYYSVCNYFEYPVSTEPRILERNDLAFYQHHTTGKEIAREAGLEDVAQNLTVSLSNNFSLNYSKQGSGRISRTTLIPRETLTVNNTPSLLLQFSDTWERLQLEPYFSNTFSSVTYQTDLSFDEETLDRAKPHAVIQFVYENELSLLLPTEASS